MFTKNLPLILLFNILLMLLACAEENNKITNNENDKEVEESSMQMTILYDNYAKVTGTKSDWGFSCLIEGAEKTILFDTGTKPEILMQNIEALNVDPNSIDLIVISHNHGDHTGGLRTILEKNSKVKVYLPFSTPASFIESIQSTGATVFTEKDPKQILDGVYLTGEMGTDILEQSLILDTPKGLVVVTGCSHQGIVNILERTKEIVNKNIYLVFGGFHLLRHSEEMVKDIISKFKSNGVQKCGCTHCTGDEAIQLFKDAFGDNFVQMGTGKVISVPLD